MLAVPAACPAGTFRAWIEAEFAEDAIPYACPHPATADRLSLPDWALRCAECYDQEQPDSGPGPWASCDAPGASTWSWWPVEDSNVIVIARVCGPCGTDGTVPLCLN